ncbi:Sugar/inositol transporter [Ascosphaera apis ARSEF 7405]|uniref:Sugar/inositol transporter n=1 Tax=Ascosphaera apis ARSEF 7405 TaxID=392613 RepID=A0A167VII5_9EURO|nr:Sugar/inositol transporter [Ascosphaera apis ARSEF 7405]
MGRGYLIGLACFAATGSFLFGYDSGVMTNVIASPNYLHYFNTYPESNIIGAINSTFAGGAAIGSLCGGYFADKWGRKPTIQLGAVIAFVGAALQASSVSLAMLLVGRIIAGWAIGLMSMAVPIYQAECAHPARRGLIIGLAQQMIGVGFIVSGWVGYACNHAKETSTFQWRFPLALQCAPAVLLAAGMFFFPESPRHLISRDRYDEGLRVLRRLHYNGSNEEWINEEFTEIKNTISAEKEIQVPGWTAMFTVPQWRKRLLIATSLQMFAQSTGTNVINYYQTVMYRNLGIKGDTVSLMACFFNMVGPITNIFFITLLIDRVGRRRPLLFGCAAITCCLLLEGICNSQNVAGDRKGLSAAGILWIYLVSVFFSLSFGPISWTYMSEIMPYQVRGTGVAFATGIGNWAISVMWSQVSPKGLGKLGWKYYFVFVAFNACVTFPCIYFFFPETKKLSLEDIDNLFGGVVDTSRWRKDGAGSKAEPELKHTEELREDTTENKFGAMGV